MYNFDLVDLALTVILISLVVYYFFPSKAQGLDEKNRDAENKSCQLEIQIKAVRSIFDKANKTWMFVDNEKEKMLTRIQQEYGYINEIDILKKENTTLSELLAKEREDERLELKNSRGRCNKEKKNNIEKEAENSTLKVENANLKTENAKLKIELLEVK